MYTLRDRNYKFVHLYTISLQTTWFCIPYKPRRNPEYEVEGRSTNEEGLCPNWEASWPTMGP